MGFLPDRSEVVLRYLFERHAKERGNRDCVLFEDGEIWSYSQALEQAYRSANTLAGLGVERGENVLIFLPNGRDWIRAWWGVNFLGAVMVPVNTAYKGEMLKHVCRNSRARFIITSPELATLLEGLNVNLEIVDPLILTEGSSSAPKPDQPIEPWDFSTILYTAGTTGSSKGVLLPYFQLYMNYESWEGMRTDDTVLIDTPLFHVSGLERRGSNLPSTQVYRERVLGCYSGK